MGDLSHGLQYAVDLDAGFNRSVSMEDVRVHASTSSDDEVLADTDNVAKTVVAAFSQPESVENSIQEPEVVVVVDERFNQLDELDSINSAKLWTDWGSIRW